MNIVSVADTVAKMSLANTLTEAVCAHYFCISLGSIPPCSIQNSHEVAVI